VTLRTLLVWVWLAGCEARAGPENESGRAICLAVRPDLLFLITAGL